MTDGEDDVVTPVPVKAQMIVPEGDLDFVTVDGRVLSRIEPWSGGGAFTLFDRDGNAAITMPAEADFSSISIVSPYSPGEILLVSNQHRISIILRGPQGEKILEIRNDLET